MGKTRLNRRADLAIALVGIVTAVVSLGPWRFRGPEIGESSVDEHAAWQLFSERCASDSLRTLAAEEADFRACDRDWNRVNDFWTSDVSGLYTIAPPKESTEVPPAELDLEDPEE